MEALAINHVARIRTFSNAGAIFVNGDGVADVYPSSLTASGFKKASIVDVNLTLRDFSHTFTQYVDVMLVAPGGRNAVVLGDVGSTELNLSAVENLTIALDDEAAESLPAGEELISGTFRPLDNLGPVDNDQPALLDFPAPARTPSGSDKLSTFDGINPNGQWQLFVLDDGFGDSGSIAGGWTLEITARAKGKSKKKR